jgi:signal transduction histidine kinase
MITISVHDTGIGMDPDQVEKIFQPFQQVSQGRDRKFEGAGLGLAIAKKYTELLGGSITVETQLTQGSTFKVSLPEYALNHL